MVIMANGKDGARRMCAAAQRERPWLKGVPAEHFLRHPGASGETNRTLRSVTAHKAAGAPRRHFCNLGGTTELFSYETVLRKLVPGVEITARPCPLFVPLVEAGYVDHSALDKQQVTRLVIAQYLAEVREAGVDTLILGCTHYPLIKEMIGWYMGRNVTLVDPAQTAAHHLERTLSEHGLKGNHEKGEAHFYVSDVPDSFAQTADLFLGEYKGGLIDQIAIDKY